MIDDIENRLKTVGTTYVRIGDMIPRWTEAESTNGPARRRLSTIEVAGRPYAVSDRFLRSLALRFHVGSEFFRYFTPDEVFERVQRVHPRTTVRLTTDRDTALGMSNPSRPYVSPGELCGLLRGQRGRLTGIDYHNGVVTSTHRMDEASWSIGRDLFSSTFTFETPIDGIGLPSVYLSVVRLICANGMIAYAPAFRTEIPLGRNADDGVAEPLGRAMDCFSNEEGYAAFRDRLEMARKSEASVYEVRMLCRAISRDLDPKKRADGHVIFDRLWKLTGDLATKYGVASDEAISRKKQSMLPMDCTVYDLLTFATEITSHHADKLQGNARTVGWVGQTLANEFDLEGSLLEGNAYERYRTPAYYLN